MLPMFNIRKQVSHAHQSVRWFYLFFLVAGISLCIFFYCFKKYVNKETKSRFNPQVQRHRFFICNNLFPSEIHRLHHVPVFQTVVEKEVWITSAFYDQREKKGQIRIIGLSSYTYDNNQLFCTLWYNSSQKSTSIRAENKNIAHYAPFQKPFKHLGFFFFCDTAARDGIPDYVSISSRPCDNRINLLHVKKLKPYNGPTTIAHCLLTIHGLYDPYQITEWLTFQKLLGVDHVFVYDYHSISRDVFRVLDYFRSTGFISIVPWHINDEMSVRAFAHRTMLNDCAYRAYGKYKYVTNHDLDELIIPKTYNSLKELLDSKDKQGVDIISFHSAVFCTKRNEFSSSYPMLRTMKYTKRMEPGVARMKWFAKPESSIEMGIHNYVKAAAGANIYVADDNEGFVHHYRFFDKSTNNCSIKDSTAHRFKASLLKNVNFVLRNLSIPYVEPD